MAKRKSEGGATIKVLIVEDQEPQRKDLCTAFRKQRCAVARCGTVNESLAKASKTCFDVVVLDMQIPVVRGNVDLHGGLTVAQLIKRYGAITPNTVVVVYTAYPKIKDCFEAIDAGAYYWPKVLPDNTPEEFVKECCSLAAGRKSRESLKPDNWLVKNYTQLAREFGGRAIAILDKGINVPSGKMIGGRRVIADSDVMRLKKRILRTAALRSCMPMVLDVFKE